MNLKEHAEKVDGPICRPRVPTIAEMEADGWEFSYGSSAYSVCVWAPDGTRIDTADILRAFAPSQAQRAEWLSDAAIAKAGKDGGA